jgi:hypothetical protein
MKVIVDTRRNFIVISRCVVKVDAIPPTPRFLAKESIKC